MIGTSTPSLQTQSMCLRQSERRAGISPAHLAVSCLLGLWNLRPAALGGGPRPHSLTPQGIEGGGTLQSKGESALVWTLQLWTQMSVRSRFSQVPCRTHRDACLRSEARSPGAENLQVHAEHTRGEASAAHCLPAPGRGRHPGHAAPGPPSLAHGLWHPPSHRDPQALLHRVQTCLCWRRLTQQPGPMRKYPEQGSR